MDEHDEYDEFQDEWEQRVEEYQVLKTEDLPYWPGAAFDANAVLDNAHGKDPPMRHRDGWME